MFNLQASLLPLFSHLSLKRFRVFRAPLHAGSDQHQFLRERVGLGIGQQRAEPVGKQIGALGTVQVKRHRASP
ncbi:hypothetical protein ABLN72_09750 [Mycobacterium tuberculosis]